MKLGLICSNEIRRELTERIQEIGIGLFADADLFIVEQGITDAPSPCIVFNPSEIDKLINLIKSLLPVLTETCSIDRLIGLKNEEYYMIDYKDILYFEAKDSIVHCHTADDFSRIKDKLYLLEKTLPKNDFIRISKSFIINIKNVDKIIPWFNRRLLLQFNKSKKEVEVSKNYVPDFKKFLGIR